jgi:hypothetical protein
MNPRWLPRTSRLAHNARSARLVQRVLGVLAACLEVARAQWLIGIPF